MYSAKNRYFLSYSVLPEARERAGREMELGGVAVAG